MRKKLPVPIEANVMFLSRRKCCICFAVNADATPKKGQIAHLDDDPSNSDPDNLCWLCMEHHDAYDSTTRQSKNYTVLEVKQYRKLLYERIAAEQPNPIPKTVDAALSRIEKLLRRKEADVAKLAKALTIKQQHVEQLQSELEAAKQEIERGKVFVASAGKTQDVSTARLAFRFGKPPKHILLVDNHDKIAYILARILNSAGYQAFPLTEMDRLSEDAWDIAHDIDIITVDLSIERPILEKVMDRAKRRNIPVMAISSYDMPEDLAYAKKIGIRKVLVKPPDLNQLMATLDELLGSKQPC